MAMVVVIATMLLAMLIAFMLNSGALVANRAEQQNTADSVGLSGGHWMARGMNTITASNHIIGEVTGIVIVHHALGGDLLDNGKTAESSASPYSNKIEAGSELVNINEELEKAYDFADGIGANVTESIYQQVRESSGVKAEAAILDAKVTLKEHLTTCYRVWFAAELLKKVKITYPAGVALATAMAALEKWIGAEYTILNATTRIAKGLSPVKQALRDQLLPMIQQFEDDVVVFIPELAKETASRIALENGAKAGLMFPLELQMPLVHDPLTEAKTMPEPDYPAVEVAGKEAGCKSCPSVPANSPRDQIVKLTQLARASFPWVVYHREPVLKALSVVPLSKAAHFYKDHSDGYSKKVCDQLQTTTTSKRSLKIQPYVLADHFAPDKGFEAFTDNPEVADEYFAFFGMAHFTKPTIVGHPIFRQQHANGQVGLAQVLLYNANAQVQPEYKIDLNCKRIRPNRQANVGWDTLNWKPGIRPSELTAKWDSGGAPAVIFPEVQANWQCKLVPVGKTRWNEMVNAQLPAPFDFLPSKLMEQTDAKLNTH